MSTDKKPCKGILKQSSSFDKEGHMSRTGDKEMKWDEMNILATYHPADKDYGHTKIDEPSTPYYRTTSESEGEGDDDTTLDAESLAARLDSDSVKPKVISKAESSEEDEDEELTEEQREKKREFIKRRKMHYNEFQAVKLARQLIEDEDDDDNCAGDEQMASASGDQLMSHETVDNVQPVGDTEAGDVLREDLV